MLARQGLQAVDQIRRDVQVDVPGAEMAGQGLKTIDAERYASLQHPGDAFSYDIFTQVTRAVREGQGLGDVEPSTVIAAGESQSAAAMVTYLNGVQPTTQAFDGFFVHSRGGSGLPVPTPGESADMASSLGRAPTIIRLKSREPKRQKRPAIVPDCRICERRAGPLVKPLRPRESGTPLRKRQPPGLSRKPGA